MGRHWATGCSFRILRNSVHTTGVGHNQDLFRHCVKLAHQPNSAASPRLSLGNLAWIDAAEVAQLTVPIPHSSVTAAIDGNDLPLSSSRLSVTSRQSNLSIHGAEHAQGTLHTMPANHRNLHVLRRGPLPILWQDPAHPYATTPRKA